MIARPGKSGPTASPGPDRSAAPRRWWPGALLALAVFLLDQAVKTLVVRTLPLGQSVPVIPGVLYLTPVRNTGIAFGLLSGVPVLVLLLAALTVVFFVLYNEGHSRRGSLRGIATGLLLGGAAGNFSDRIRLGYVIDYLDVRVWPVFNLADAAVVCGSALLFLTLLGQKRGAT